MKKYMNSLKKCLVTFKEIHYMLCIKKKLPTRVAGESIFPVEGVNQSIETITNKDVKRLYTMCNDSLRRKCSIEAAEHNKVFYARLHMLLQHTLLNTSFVIIINSLKLNQ